MDQNFWIKSFDRKGNHQANYHSGYNLQERKTTNLYLLKSKEGAF